MPPRVSGPLLLMLLAGCQSPDDINSGASPDAADTLAASPWASRLGDMVTTGEEVDDLGFTHVRVQQVVDGVPVFGGEAIIHLLPDGKLRSVTDNRLADVSVDTVPEATDDEALLLALSETGLAEGELTEAPTTELVILRIGSTDHLAWVVQLERIDETSDPTRPQVFVDAHSGAVLRTIEGIRTGSGASNYSGTVEFETYHSDSVYYLEDTSRDIGTYSFSNTSTSVSYVTDADDVWTHDRAAIDVHYGAKEAIDYYWETFDRDGLDGSGGPRYIDSLDGGEAVISMMVHYNRNYNNAFYAGNSFVFGDGDGVTFGKLTALDVVAHELTHAVNGHTAGFIYHGESGALDEGFADIFAVMIERQAYGDSDRIWTIGEDCYTPGTAGDALRYMYSPSLNGYSPDHYSSRYTGSQDNAGVHVNSGIIGLAFYLHAVGGQHPTSGDPLSVDGTSADVAAEIWYRALNHYLTAASTFADARVAVLSAAADLYGQDSDEYAAAQDAWYLVGVGTAAPEREETDPVDDTVEDDGPIDDTDDEPIEEEEDPIDEIDDEVIEEDPVDEIPTGACSDHAWVSEGSLAGLNDFAVEPSGGDYTVSSGTHAGCVSTDADATLMLVLMEWTGENWLVQAIEETEDGEAALTAELDSGTMSWLVAAEDAGAGLSYTFGLTTPAD